MCWLIGSGETKKIQSRTEFSWTKHYFNLFGNSLVQSGKRSLSFRRCSVRFQRLTLTSVSLEYFTEWGCHVVYCTVVAESYEKTFRVDSIKHSKSDSQTFNPWLTSTSTFSFIGLETGQVSHWEGAHYADASLVSSLRGSNQVNLHKTTLVIM